jgi:DNA mismatch endonuclease (patch repair protein)
MDGCFWHGCPKHATKPKGNAAFWRRKLAANRGRDALVTRTLRRAGLRVLRVWEHELVRKNQARLVRRITEHVKKATRPVRCPDFRCSLFCKSLFGASY